MELPYIVQFYDANESGCVEHNELYTTRKAADRRFSFLKNHLNCYSWVNLWSTRVSFGRILCHECLDECRSCNGADGYYHGNESDF